jgi:hypothetical protein
VGARLGALTRLFDGVRLKFQNQGCLYAAAKNVCARKRYATIEQGVNWLQELSYFERAGAHILAGWIVKIPELDIKLAFG